MPRHLTPALTLFLTLGFASVPHAQTPPGWWAERGATNANPPNNHAAVTQGQLKHFTQRAVEELNARIPGGAGADLNNLVNGWLQEYQIGNHSAQNPLPADFHAMTAGQLKWTAQKLHSRLQYTQYTGTPPAWIETGAATNDQLANLGQLKTVFNFDLTASTGQLPDWWQKFHFNGQTGIDPGGDADGDGISNLDEYEAGSHPRQSGSIPLPTLAAHWKFIPGAETVALDSGPDGHTGTILGGATWGSGFNGLGGLVFDGTDDRVQAAAASHELLNFGQQSFAISIWFKTTETNNRRLVSKGHSGWTPGYLLSIGHTGPGMVGFGIGSSTLFSTVESFNDAEWHHVAAVCDRTGSRLRIYVDGELRNIAKHSGTAGTMVENGTALDISGLSLTASSTVPLSIGSALQTISQPYEFFKGEIDDVRLYRGNLTPEQVRYLHEIDEYGPDDFDRDGIPDAEDADPENTAVGTLAVTILSPASGNIVK